MRTLLPLRILVGLVTLAAGGCDESSDDLATDAGLDADLAPTVDALPADGASADGRAVDAAVDARIVDASVDLAIDGRPAGPTDGAAIDAPLTIHGVSRTGCYEVATVSNVNDGCAIGLAGTVGRSLPGTYNHNTATMSLGRVLGTPPQPSLGSGLVTYNMGTLLRNNVVADSATCTRQEIVTTRLTVTAVDAFTLSVTEQQQLFSTGCTNPPPPSGGACTSTWTWTVRKGPCADGGL